MYSRPRVIPVLGIIDDDLVKTIKYNNPRYLGDPVNAVKIFNGKYVDELVLLDIRASLENQPINFELLANIAQQAFMPLGYGGGITSLEDVKKLFRIGFEKVIFNTAFVDNINLIKETVTYAGSQSVVVSLDFKKNTSGKYYLHVKSGTKKVDLSFDEIINRIKEINVGEVIINVIDRDGMMVGYDYGLINTYSSALEVPVIANTGAGKISDFKEALNNGAHGVAGSSIFVYYGKKKSVLITFPSEKDMINATIYWLEWQIWKYF